jgi:hypothetical protein
LCDSWSDAEALQINVITPQLFFSKEAPVYQTGVLWSIATQATVRLTRALFRSLKC